LRNTSLEKQRNQLCWAIQEQLYQVGKIMYLVTKLLVEGCNAARELSKHLQKPVEEHWKELERFVGYLKVNGSDIKITYCRPKELHMMAMVDSYYATNTDDRTSLTGAIFTVARRNNHKLDFENPRLSDTFKFRSRICGNHHSSTRGEIHTTTTRRDNELCASSNYIQRQYRHNILG
jgi:hypothetical protein